MTKQLIEHQLKSEKLHSAVSVIISISSSVQREMENSVLMYNVLGDPQSDQ